MEEISANLWGRTKLFFYDWFVYGFKTARYNQRWISKHK